MSSTSLTSYLLQHNARVPYAAATEHLFLTQAGDGTLPSRRLALWLSQDRIYAAHAYPRFIGRLIAAIPFSSNIDPKEIASQNRILKALVEALNNIVREANFFVDVATKYGLDINCWHERQGTRNYTAEMARVSSESLQDGLVFLWAMEKVVGRAAKLILFNLLSWNRFILTPGSMPRCSPKKMRRDRKLSPR
jgi:formylaminopyrimidine deformylase / aminopyrimidine aminohydrolase